MKFPDGFSNHLKSIAFRFKWQKIQDVAEAACGVYIFIHKRSYLYVGKGAGSDGVRERLLAHYNGTHNKELERNLKALNGTVRVAVIECESGDVDDLEKSLIRHLQPSCNDIRYQDYQPSEKELEI